MLVYVLVAAAAVLLLWPANKARTQPTLIPIVPPEQTKRHSPSYIEAVQALQVVRSRLASTSKLEQEQQQACSVLTLALSEGSEQ